MTGLFSVDHPVEQQEMVISINVLFIESLLFTCSKPRKKAPSDESASVDILSIFCDYFDLRPAVDAVRYKTAF